MMAEATAMCGPRVGRLYPSLQVVLLSCAAVVSGMASSALVFASVGIDVLGAVRRAQRVEVRLPTVEGGPLM